MVGQCHDPSRGPNTPRTPSARWQQRTCTHAIHTHTHKSAFGRPINKFSVPRQRGAIAPFATGPNSSCCSKFPQLSKRCSAIVQRERMRGALLIIQRKKTGGAVLSSRADASCCTLRVAMQLQRCASGATEPYNGWGDRLHAAKCSQSSDDV